MLASRLDSLETTDFAIVFRAGHTRARARRASLVRFGVREAGMALARLRRACFLAVTD
jgi:hypothetical protein